MLRATEPSGSVSNRAKHQTLQAVTALPVAGSTVTSSALPRHSVGDKQAGQRDLMSQDRSLPAAGSRAPWRSRPATVGRTAQGCGAPWSRGAVRRKARSDERAARYRSSRSRPPRSRRRVAPAPGRGPPARLAAAAREQAAKRRGQPGAVSLVRSAHSRSGTEPARPTSPARRPQLPAHDPADSLHPKGAPCTLLARCRIVGSASVTALGAASCLSRHTTRTRGVLTQPCVHGSHLGVGQHVDTLPATRIDHDRRVSVPFEQRELVQPQDPRYCGARLGYTHQAIEHCHP